MTDSSYPLASPAMGHYGTCLDFQLFNFSGHFTSEPHKLLTFDSMCLPKIRKKEYSIHTFIHHYTLYTGLYLCHCLLHGFHNIFVCRP